MSTAVITVASGGLPVVDVTATTPLLGLPVTEAIAVSGVKYGIAVTQVTLPKGGLPVTYWVDVDVLGLARIEVKDVAAFVGTVA